MRYETVICGAGIAGVSAAHYLTVQYGCESVLLVESGQPLALTTARSGENFRDYWPDPSMGALAVDSIELMQDLLAKEPEAFAMKNSGYLFASKHAGRDIFPPSSTADAYDRMLDQEELHHQWPHLDPGIEQVVRVRRAGAIDVHALGSHLLRQARANGTDYLNSEVTALEPTAADTVNVIVGDTTINADRVVLATGPFLGPMAAAVGADLHLTNVAQRKFVLPDPAAVIPPDMAFTIFADPVELQFSDEERNEISSDPAMRWLLEPLPAGLHVKPEPGGLIKLGWAFNRTAASAPKRDIELDEMFPSIVLRGASQMIPGLGEYVDDIPTPVRQYGGYYTRTPENWPVIGPTCVEGIYALGGLAGFGTMMACGAGELLARHLTGAELPEYARRFHPQRYDDPQIVAEIAALASDGQL